MEQLVRIRQVHDDGTAQVVLIRQSACSGDCHQCSGCGAAQQTVVFDAVNAINARAGELVIVKSKSGPVLAAAAVLYMLPVALFFVGYMLGELLWTMGALAGCIAFVLGIAIAAVYDRKVAKNQKTVYTITGYPTASALDSQIKGDNDLD